MRDGEEVTGTFAIMKSLSQHDETTKPFKMFKTFKTTKPWGAHPEDMRH
jgi:hypothetical protein